MTYSFLYIFGSLYLDIAQTRVFHRHVNGHESAIPPEPAPADGELFDQLHVGDHLENPNVNRNQSVSAAREFGRWRAPILWHLGFGPNLCEWPISPPPLRHRGHPGSFHRIDPRRKAQILRGVVCVIGNDGR